MHNMTSRNRGVQFQEHICLPVGRRTFRSEALSFEKQLLYRQIGTLSAVTSINSAKAPNPMIRTLCSAVVAIVLTGATGTVSAQPRLNLPQMGEPADQVMSPRDEKRIGRGIMRQIRMYLELVTDPEVNHYVQTLGKRLVATQPGVNADDFTFFVVNNPEINAFALPGGYIGVNSGLITSAANESQLASVIAHEAAHVMQRHIARMYASQGNQGMKTAAAVLAAILISQRSAEAGQAALLTGLAASQQSAINFTRSNEYEADRLGVQLLADANYNPRGMVDFFEVLRRRTALNVTEQMEFLQTHPLTTNRISEARNNAQRFANPVGIQNTTEFQFQQMKLKVLHNTNPNAMLRSLRDGHISSSESVRLYGQILLHLNSGRGRQASDPAKRLLSLQPDNSAARLAVAKVAIETGELDRAKNLLQSIIDIQPDNYAAVEALIDALIKDSEAQRAVNVSRQYLRGTSSPVPAVYRKYAAALQRTDRMPEAHEAMADYYFALDVHREAMSQLKLALKSADEETNTWWRIKARIDRFQKELNQP